MLNTSCIGTIRSKVKFKCTVLVCKTQNKYQPEKGIEKLSILFLLSRKKKECSFWTAKDTITTDIIVLFNQYR